MKKFLLKTWLTMVCLLVFGAGSAWAENVTFTAEDYEFSGNDQTVKQTIDGVTFEFSKGSTNPQTYPDGLRTYEGCSITISSSVNITEIAFTYTISNSGCLKDATVGTWNDSKKTWTGSAKSIGLTVGHSSGTKNGQVKITKIVVTTESAAKKDYKVFKESSITIAPEELKELSEYINEKPTDYNGTIYYTCSDTESEYVLFDSDELSVMGYNEGSATIYAVASATSTYNEVYEELTINVEIQKAENGLSYATPAYTFTCFDEDKATQSLTNPNGLPVAYESNNTSVATVDEAGVVTVKDYAGTATITATFEGDEDYKAGSASFDITVNRAETGYAFSESSVDVTIGERFNVPTITATNAEADLTLNFTSSKANVAAVSPTGKNTYNLTVKGTGTTIIKASWNQTPRFERGEVFYTLNVTDANAGTGEITYKLVTSTNELVAGNKYLLVNKVAAKTINTKTDGNNRPGVDVTFENDIITGISDDADVITLGGESGAWTFAVTGGYLYASNTSAGTSNHMKTQATASDNAKASITIDAQGNANIVFAGNHNGRNVIRYNNNTSGGNMFSCYESGKQQTVQLYKEVSEAAPKAYGQFTISDYFTDGEGNYYGTFYSENAWEVPAGVEAQAVGVNGNKLTISTLNDNDNNVVAAGTAVLLKASAPGTYVYAESDEEGASAANNLLDGSSEAVTAESMASAHPNCIYYRMTKHNGTTLGFWWGAEDGAAFALAANKAYLAVPQQASNLLGFRFGDDTLTAIQEAEIENNGSAIYNLQGQRINRLQQGVNIVNGKKVIR